MRITRILVGQRSPAVIVHVSLAAALAVFALTAGYATGADFASGTIMVGAVLQSVAVNGAMTSTVLFVGLFVLLLASRVACQDAPTESRRWAAGVAVTLALTLTIPPFVPEGSIFVLSVSPVLHAIPDSAKTVWYWLFMALRFLGFCCALQLPLRCLFMWAVRSRAGASDACMRLPDPGASSASVQSGSARSVNVQSADAQAAAAQARTQMLNPGLSSRMRQVLQEGALDLTKRFRPLFETLSSKSVLLIAAVIAVCWIPWMALLYPANIAADTVAQLVWARGNMGAWDPSSRLPLPGYRMSDHHPWFDTVIYGGFDRLGLALGDEGIGLFALAVAQTLLCATALALLLCYAGGKLHVPWQVCTAGLGLYALVPIFGRLSMSIVKDSTFMPFFLAWLTIFMEYTRRIRARERLGWRIPAGLVALALVCGLTKKTALFIIVATMLVAAAVLGHRVTTAVCAALIVALFAGVTATAFAALRVAPAGKQEMLAIPLQQTAYDVLRHGRELSASDSAVLGRVFVCDAKQVGMLANSRSSDAIKDHCFNHGSSRGDMLRFLGVWAKQGLAHPGTYLAAVPWLRDPFTMGAIYDEGFYVRWGWKDKGGMQILPQYGDAQRSPAQRYGATLYYGLAKMPVLGALMSENLYVVWIPLLGIALCVLRRCPGNLLYALPLLLSTATLLISPAYQTRYSWALAYGAFVFVTLGFIRDSHAVCEPDHAALVGDFQRA